MGTYAMTTETLACNDSATTLKGDLAFAETTTGTRPDVLLMQEAFGDLPFAIVVMRGVTGTPLTLRDELPRRTAGRHTLLPGQEGVAERGVRLIAPCAAP